MNVSILGLEWSLPACVALADLFAELNNRRGQEQEFGGYSRLVFVGGTAAYHTGLILTTKDYRRFCEMRRLGRGVRINVREAEAGTSLIDFNFFMIHKHTGRGLFQYYHHSCHPNVFSRFCSRIVSSLREQKLNAAIAAAGGQAISEHEKTRIEGRHNGMMEWRLLVREENFAALVAEFQKIGSFEVDFGAVGAEQERLFRGFQGVSERLVHRVSFRRHVTVRERRQAIMDFIRQNRNLAGAAVHGVDEDGLAATVRLAENPDSFGHYDFDELAAEMIIDPAEYRDSPTMQRLIRVARDNAAIFEMPAQ